jgi:hypothetical protein
MPRQLRLQYPGAVYHPASQGEELKRRPKSDRDKLEIGARLRRETTLTLKAIAARVHLGSSKSANANLHRHMRAGAPHRRGEAGSAGRRK